MNKHQQICVPWSGSPRPLAVPGKPKEALCSPATSLRVTRQGGDWTALAVGLVVACAVTVLLLGAVLIVGTMRVLGPSQITVPALPVPRSRPDSPTRAPVRVVSRPDTPLIENRDVVPPPRREEPPRAIVPPSVREPKLKFFEPPVPGPSLARRSHTLIVQSVSVKPTQANGKKWDPEGPNEAPDLYVMLRRDEPALQKEVEQLERAIKPLQWLEHTHTSIQSRERFLETLPVGHPSRRTWEQWIAADKAKGARPLTRVERQRLQQMRLRVVDLRSQYEDRTPIVWDRYTATFNWSSLGVGVGDEVSLRVLDKDFLWDDLAGQYYLLITAEILREGFVELRFNQVKSLRLEFRPK